MTTSDPQPDAATSEHPTEAAPEAQLTAIVRQMVQVGASDLHLRVGMPAMVRIDGALRPLTGSWQATEGWLSSVVDAVTSVARHRYDEFVGNGETDLAWEAPGVGRFRVNAFLERGRTSLVLRAVSREVNDLAELGMPEVVRAFAGAERGLVLVTGATGSGKSTTLAAMVDHINRTYPKHVITIEDPIEVIHTNNRAIISQREVGIDTPDFSQALRRALRQDPDVILVGEIRDEETMRVALAAAETGHLVLATLHTMNAAESIARVLDLFPIGQDRQARSMLAGALVGIVSQRLVAAVAGGRVPAVEILATTGRIQRCIAVPEESHRLHDIIADGHYYGMQTFDQALLKLLYDGIIDVDEAMRNVTAEQDFLLMMEAAGLGPDGKLTAEAAIALEAERARQAAEDEVYAREQRLASLRADAPLPPATPIEHEDLPDADVA